MFDDKPVQGGPGAPANLPVQEPEDIFLEKDASAPPAITPPAAPSALAAGALKARKEDIPSPPSPPTAGYPLKEPRFSRYLLLAGVAILVIGALGGGGWFLYSKFVVEKPEVAPPPPEETVTEPPPEPPPAEEPPSDESILFGEPIDVDGDGLDAARETDLGTDPNNWDTDSDGLSDYDEVAVWKSDPLNPDTDGDGYTDGDEVKNGYSPTGPGKIFEPPPAQ